MLREDPMVDLMQILKECKVKVTFSPNCCSGIVAFLGPTACCQCYRCRKGRGQKVSDATERAAERITARAKKAFNKSLGIGVKERK